MNYFPSPEDFNSNVLRFSTPRPQILEASPLYPEYSDGESAGFGAYWRVISQRRWTVLTVLVIVTVMAAITAFKMRPIYRGTAQVEIDNETPMIQSLADLAQARSEPDQDFLRSQTQVLEANQLAWRTIEALGLSNNPEFASKLETESSEQRKLALIKRFKDALTVTLLPTSRVIRVEFDSPDPQLAANVANDLVRNYTDYNFSEKYEATRQASARMEEQLDELKAKVESSQKALVDYQRQHSIANINDKQNVVELRLSQLSTDLSNAQSDRIQKESVYRLLKGDPSQIASVAENQLLQKLQEKYADLSNQYTEALNQYGPNFPKVMRLKSQLADAQTQIQNERQRVSSKAEDEYRTAVDREQLLSSEVAKQKEELGKVNSLLVQQNILTGEFESNQKMYQALQQRLKDATISAGLKTANIHLIDPALPPSRPIRPKKLEYTVLGGVLGLFLGVAMVFVQNELDSSVKTAEEIETLIGAPALASVPVSQFKGRGISLRKANMLDLDSPSPSSGTPSVSLAVLHAPRSPIAESFRGLRTSFLFRAQRKCRTVLVTSPHPGDGKSSTAINLAITLGQRGKSVLLVDSDLRKPSVAPVLGLDGRKGLTTLLAGRHTLEESIQAYEPVPQVSILTSGPINQDSPELIAPERLDSLLTDLGTKFEHIIIDSPPVLAVADAGVLASLVDGVVLVISADQTPRRAVSSARRVLELAGARVLGVVLNKVNSSQGEYYGYYAEDYQGKDNPRRHTTGASC